MVALLALLAGCPAGPACDDKGGCGDTAPEPSTEDQDGDGYSPATGDCDDALPHVYPGAPDYCDGLDQDCDGEPIPDGSCSLRGDGRAMWSWLVQANSDFEGFASGPAGDQDGDGLEELRLEVTDFHADVGGQRRAGSLFGGDWSSQPAVTDYSTSRVVGPSNHYVYSGQSFAGDLDGDGLNEMFVETYDSDYSDGAVLLFYGRPEGWSDGGGTLEGAADAYWSGAGEPNGLQTYPGGDFNGDGFGDLFALTALPSEPEGVLAMVFGSPERAAGAQMLTALPMASYEAGSLRVTALSTEVVSDLDGDGTDELTFVFLRESDETYFQAFASGAEVVDGAHLADSVSLIRYEDGNIPNPLTYHTHEAGDWNGDGYHDLAAAPYPEDDELVCASLLSGGLPEGVVEHQAFAQICGVQYPDSVIGWVPDMDDDGEPEMLADWNCMVVSHRIVIGGTVLLSEVGAPCFSGGEDQGLTDAVANITGDSRPEFAMRLLYGYPESEAYSTAIIAGFDIPWDDPSKW